MGAKGDGGKHLVRKESGCNMRESADRGRRDMQMGIDAAAECAKDDDDERAAPRE